jgi:hypothetical protein
VPSGASVVSIRSLLDSAPGTRASGSGSAVVASGGVVGSACDAYGSVMIWNDAADAASGDASAATTPARNASEDRAIVC